jgi:hypothetical protein
VMVLIHNYIVLMGGSESTFVCQVGQHASLLLGHSKPTVVS